MKVEPLNLKYISWLLRLSMGSLFLAAAIIKIPNGVEGAIGYYLSMFEKSIFPLFLVKAHASVIIFVEVALGIWLLSGYKLRAAWMASGVLLVSLAFGMVFVYKFDVASDNYLYVLICCSGLLVEGFDSLRVGS